MKLQHTFWLISLAAIFATPVAAQHCTGKAQAQATNATTTSSTIHVSNQPVGIPITGVN